MSTPSVPHPIDAENKILGPAWRSAFGAALGLTVGPSVLLVMAFGVFLPALRAEFGWSLAEGAIGSAVISIAIVLSSPLQGLLCDRLGARRMILFSAIPFGAGVMAMSLMPGELWAFYAACAVLPLLGLGLWPVTYNKAAAGWFDRRLGLAMGVVATGIGLGAMVIPPLTAHLIVTQGWRSAYLLLGLVSFAITLLTGAMLLRSAPTTSGRATTTDGDRFRHALRSASYRILLIAFILLGIASSAILVHQPSLLLEAGFSLTEVGMLQGVVGAAVIVGRLGVGWLLDRVSVRWIMPPILLAASVGCAMFASGTTGVAVPIAAAMLGLMLGAEMDVLGYLIGRNHGSGAFGALYGIVFAGFSLGSALGAATVGKLHAVYGGYAIPFAGLAVILAVCAALFSSPLFARGRSTGSA